MGVPHIVHEALKGVLLVGMLEALHLLEEFLSHRINLRCVLQVGGIEGKDVYESADDEGNIVSLP